jgi:chemotaxis signal transduction protein
MDVTTTSQAHLIFRLHRALFALAAMAIREVLPLPAIAAVEETPPYVVGAINLRGRVVPILDLNLRFGHSTVPSRLTLVTKRSSPTNWTLSPASSVCNFQPSQSSSCIPSSMERMGY